MKWIKYKDNLPVNLSRLLTLKKDEIDHNYVILFYETLDDCFKWDFDTEEERDKVLKRIEEIAIDINIKI